MQELYSKSSYLPYLPNPFKSGLTIKYFLFILFLGWQPKIDKDKKWKVPAKAIYWMKFDVCKMKGKERLSAEYMINQGYSSVFSWKLGLIERLKKSKKDSLRCPPLVSKITKFRQLASDT